MKQKGIGKPIAHWSVIDHAKSLKSKTNSTELYKHF